MPTPTQTATQVKTKTVSATKFAIAIACLGVIFVSTPVLAISTTKIYHNDLPRRDWVKYGVNPWSIDTDNDGYFDAAEVKNGFCPTNADSEIKLTDKECVKGKIDLNRKVYTPPAMIKEELPRDAKKFASCSAMKKYFNQKIKDIRNKYQKAMGSIDLGVNFAQSTGLASSEGLETYSETNVQTEGVDEGDVIETDGKYIYRLRDALDTELQATNRILSIIKVASATEAKVVAEIDVDDDFHFQEMYLSGKFLTLVGSSYSYRVEKNRFTLNQNYSYYGNYSSTNTVIEIYDVSKPELPKLARSVMLEGRQLGSRLYSGYLYLVLNYTQNHLWNDKYEFQADEIMPRYFTSVGKIDGKIKQAAQPLARCADVLYFDSSDRFDYLEVVSVPIGKTGKINSQVIVGSGKKIYMSQSNLYVLDERVGWSGYKGKEATDIYKFALNSGAVKLVAQQAVPGTALNQFSLDEYKGNLRIFTNMNRWVSPDGKTKNNFYILDKDLNRIGWYTGFGETERIYSARFIGDRAYVVTFEQTDPLFVFDASNPHEPKLMGELLLPGFSNYLHPYDENHLIGIGREMNTNITTSSVSVTGSGLKLGLFDVTDPAAPKEIFKVVLGDWGSTSPALNDHHSFLFSRAKNLLAFPVLLTQLTEEQKKTGNYWDAKISFGGMIVFDVGLDNGFVEKGRIKHYDGELTEANSRSLLGLASRSVYINDYLFSFSQSVMTVHRLSDMEEVNRIELEQAITNEEFLEGAKRKARDAKRLSDLKQIQTALELYYTDKDAYPTGASLTLGSINAACLNLSGWQASSCTVSYMGMVPSDPGNSAYVYSSADGSKYEIKAHLEGTINGLSGDITVSPAGIKD